MRFLKYFKETAFWDFFDDKNGSTYNRISYDDYDKLSYLENDAMNKLEIDICKKSVEKYIKNSSLEFLKIEIAATRVDVNNLSSREPTSLGFYLHDSTVDSDNYHIYITKYHDEWWMIDAMMVNDYRYGDSDYVYWICDSIDGIKDWAEKEALIGK